MTGRLQQIMAFIAAVIAATLLGSIVQTQFNLARIADLGAPVPLGPRLESTLHDLVHFAPLYGLTVTAALLIGFAAAAVLTRRLAAWRTPLYTLAGFAAIVVMLLVMQLVLSITPIAAARTLSGVVGLGLAGAFGGWLFARLTQGFFSSPRAVRS